MIRFQNIIIAALGLCLGCNAPSPAPTTGGADLPDGPCGRGLVVVSSDYQSTNISVTGSDGAIVSASFVSSASESTALSAPLSGDVVVPNVRVAGDDVVLIDRYPASVITWVDLKSGVVRAQLDVSTGFAANPRDYLELADGRAYVTRFESNPTPGAEDHDGGGDILILDPAGPAIVGRIDLTPAMQDAPTFLPRASRMATLDGEVYVLLLAYNEDFSNAAPSRLVRISPVDNTIIDVTLLDNLYGCEGLTTRKGKVAVTCSGVLSGGSTTSAVGSGLAVLDTADQTLTITRADALLGQPLGFAVAFTRTGVLVSALGAFGTEGSEDTLDAVLHVEEGGAFSTIMRSTSRPFELGDIRCNNNEDQTEDACRCFVTDGELGVLHRLHIDDGSYEVALPLDDGIGLPPRAIGRL